MRAHLPTIECEVCKHCVILACWPERDLRDLRLQGEAFVMGLELLGPLPTPTPPNPQVCSQGTAGDVCQCASKYRNLSVYTSKPASLA